jgi:hypothetical protein
MPPDNSSLAAGPPPDSVRDLLEDFDLVGAGHHVALIRRYPGFAEVRHNVQAALVASALNLNSIDYAKRRYCDENKPATDPLVEAYVASYIATKMYVEHVRLKLQPAGLPEPSAGVFTAAMVLERLPSSFFSAHFLYRLGHRFEGHAISRLILEQIAWAYAAHSINEVVVIEGIEATRAISELKRFAPEVGRLYGFLSAKTHIGYSSHLEFLGTENGKNVVFHAHPRYIEFAEIVLSLGDLYGLVWELSQFAYIKDPEAVELRDGNVLPRSDRPFLRKSAECLAVVKEREQADKLRKGGAAPSSRPIR